MQQREILILLRKTIWMLERKVSIYTKNVKMNLEKGFKTRKKTGKGLFKS